MPHPFPQEYERYTQVTQEYCDPYTQVTKEYDPLFKYLNDPLFRYPYV